MWFVYMLECADGTIYCGITVDLERRVDEHNSSPLGAKYTKARRPVKLIYSEQLETRSEASKREREFKKLTRKQKQELFQK